MMRGNIPGVSWHARQRYFERFGRMATPAQWNAMLVEILEQRARLVSMRPDGAEKLSIMWAGRPLHLVWDPSKATIVTVLGEREPHMVPRHKYLRVWERRA